MIIYGLATNESMNEVTYSISYETIDSYLIGNVQFILPPFTLD